MIFTTKANGKTKAAIGDAHAILAEPGQPISIAFNCIPKFLIIAWAAGPRLSQSSATTKLIPTNPTPIVRPEWNDFAGPHLKISPIMNINTGNITVGPNPKNAWNIGTKFSIISLLPLLNFTSRTYFYVLLVIDFNYATLFF